MKIRGLLLNITYCILACCAAKGQTGYSEGLESQIDALVPTIVSEKSPGMVIGIVEKGELIFSKGYGMANLSYGMPNDGKLVYNVGSVAKQFLGYAYAQLHVDGSLDIDDPVSKYLEDWPEFDQVVTLRNLLTHTSGYREAYTISNLAGRPIGIDRLSREECLEVVRRQPALEFTPGSRYTYNSTAWVILAEIFEKITGEPAETWVERELLQPLGMNNTQIESYVGEVIENTAESYSFSTKTGFVNEKSNRAFFGAADIITSVEDLAKWMSVYTSASIGGDKVRDLFLEPFVFNNGINSGYALGIGNTTYRGLKRYRHTGGHEAYITNLSYYPDQELGIIVISNFGGIGMVPSTRIADLLLGDQMIPLEDYEDQRVEISHSELEKFSGFYIASTLNEVIDVGRHANTLKVGSRVDLVPTSSSTFIAPRTGESYEISPDSHGGFTMKISNHNSVRTYQRADDDDSIDSNLNQYIGEYWSNEIETVYHINVNKHYLELNHRWLGSVKLFLVSTDFFEADKGFFVQFVRNQAGDIDALEIYSSRTLKVLFEKKTP